MNPLVWVVLLILGLAVVAFAYKALTERKERQRLPPPGQLVELRDSARVGTESILRVVKAVRSGRPLAP